MTVVRRVRGAALAIAVALLLAGPLEMVSRAWDFIWTLQFGDDGTEVGAGGRIVVAGSTNGALPDQVHAGNRDLFLRAYKPDGTALWTRRAKHVR